MRDHIRNMTESLPPVACQRAGGSESIVLLDLTVGSLGDYLELQDQVVDQLVHSQVGPGISVHWDIQRGRCRLNGPLGHHLKLPQLL